MSHPIVHAEIRSSDPDATRAFFGDLFGWTYPTEGAFPGYTFVETGVPGALYTAISPLQGDSDLVTFFVGVEDMATTIADTTRLGGRVVQEPVSVPGCRSRSSPTLRAMSWAWPNSSDLGRQSSGIERRSPTGRSVSGKASEPARTHHSIAS